MVATPDSTTTTVTTGSAPVATTTPPTPGVPRVAAIGDSVMKGAEPALLAQVPGVWVNAEVSRGFGLGLELIRSLHDNHQLADTVVIHLGTNGVITDGQMEALLAILKDRKRVVFVNLKVPRSWEAQDNAVLAAWAPRFPNGVLIDWHNLGGAHPEFFYGDGIHLRPDGARYYADLIAQQTPANP